MYSIGKFAKLIDKSVITLQRWDRDGVLKAHRTPSNRRYYTDEQLMEYKGLKSTDKSKAIVYCRISSKNQQDDLKNQKEYVSEFCLNAGIPIDEWLTDIGSGLNYTRKHFNQLMKKVECGQVKKIIIAHKDRLVRFGYEWFEKFCNEHGCEILIINNDKLSPQEELVQDLTNIIHVFSCRIYGLRKYKKKIQQDKEINEFIS